MLDVARGNSRLLQGDLHRPLSALPIFAPGGHVKRVRCGAVADQFCDRLRTPRLRVIERLDHYDAGALAHYESVAVAIERPRRALRHVVEARRNCAPFREATLAVSDRPSRDGQWAWTAASASAGGGGRAQPALRRCSGSARRWSGPTAP